MCARSIWTASGVLPHRCPAHPEIVASMMEDVLTVSANGSATDLGSEARTALAQFRERWWHAQDYVNAYIDGPQVAVIEWTDPLRGRTLDTRSRPGRRWTPRPQSERRSLETNRTGGSARDHAGETGHLPVWADARGDREGCTGDDGNSLVVATACGSGLAGDDCRRQCHVQQTGTQAHRRDGVVDELVQGRTELHPQGFPAASFS